MEKINITLPDGSAKKYKKGITSLEIAESIGPRLAKDALAAKVEGKFVDLSEKINKNSKIQIITFGDQEGKDALRHSVAHLLAAAVMDLWPNTKRAIGPAIENGFYFDFEFKKPITEQDLPKIEKKMREILPKWDNFSRHLLDAKEAKKQYPKNQFKHEMIDEFSEKGKKKVSFYKSGDYWDLCRGGHVSSMKKIPADSFKLTHIAGAYWRGNENNPQLTRIYGVAFSNKKDLNIYFKLLEEAEKRDHRKLGKQLDLFSLHEESPGIIFFHPKGVVIFNLLIEFIRKKLNKLSYDEIKTPMILSKKLWEQSGHWDHYKENMYFTKVDEQDFAIKPMNCPGSVLVYKDKLPSYRDLPIRLSEFGVNHRHELSGVLSGLFRVRAFTMDDAHIFLMPNQIENEIIQLIDLVDYVYKTFGFSYDIELSTRPEKFAGKKQNWDTAEKSLGKALDKKKLKYKINEGDGAFYGPKIDFNIKDCLGRTWQCATIQIDFLMPEKFNLKYIGEDGAKHQPVMIHRAIYGSIERFMGILIEHYAGKFPLWLAPIQARILTVSEKFSDYAIKIKEELQEQNLRVELDLRTESVGYKVREAQAQKIPLIVNVGEKEEKNKTLAVRTLDNKVYFGIKLENFIKNVKQNIMEKDSRIEF